MWDSGRLHKIISNILTLVIILGSLSIIFFLYFVNKGALLRYTGTLILAALLAVWILFEFRWAQKSKEQAYSEYESPIKRFVLIAGGGEREKEWYCEGAKSFLIGKSTAGREVDMELGDTEYSEYIADEHAALNYADGFWYIEDLDSLNGVGIKKRDEEFALRIKPGTPYKIDEGDIIYISKAKILAM